MTGKESTYATSGVDIHQEEDTIKSLTKTMTYKREGFGAPLTDIGHYAGLMDFGEFAIAMTTDGVGSKVLIANEMGKWDTIGIDCVAMNVNDLLAIGAEPIGFVDYLALEKHKPGFAAEVGIGLAKGAEISKMSIVGGETATLPDIIKGFDLAGTCIGAVKKEDVLTGEKIKVGDVIIGLKSSGIHSNGYSLVRKIIKESPYDYQDYCPYNPKTTIGDELLVPTKIYMEVLDVLKKHEVHGLAHITGSGLLKLRRITNLGFDFDDPIEPPEIFKFLQEQGNVSDLEMYKTFNMGMGFIIIVPEEVAPYVMGMTGGKRVGKIVESGIKLKNLVIE
ncbi:phosphoribosylformylglycinamidine cyclo-ligase [Methanimicrococcus blatticola]|uniref:Phosphoribosylformylglycinamidine cyclo-ligase n=1 Tax=Methanimicrococcus blatticola TaxID=91560 RepID=A0A484F2A5_9EURY|nr:phosphoribosylformylglycinamidine cyclo-ligase [Methanimicrococcus blatticola]MBZ3936383.1 phosphoribosylformylglycinamidine cyclo-ligase [Methanimicrococcus blatticola]MCC2509545.1 phosphoribosylformylglycinamidine cyclo-ligase [Methanimicrococcus blatticola]TDQ67597.1 phosphoribosylformylglycinamidine cyclo-ligase [Methanimicrococcus blatticola]